MWWKEFDTRRGQLNRQRHPIETPTHRHDRRRVVDAEREGSVRGLGTVHEQLNRIGCRDRVELGVNRR